MNQETLSEDTKPSVLFSADRPAHYQTAVTPWCLQKHMKSSGDLFVDARRTDVIEYVFRIKSNMLEDMKKARHNLDAIIERLEEMEANEAKTKALSQGTLAERFVAALKDVKFAAAADSLLVLFGFLMVFQAVHRAAI